MSDATLAEVFMSFERTIARAAGLLLPPITCAVLANFRDSVPSATAVLVLVLWVVAAAATGDRLAGVLAAVSGVCGFDFFLIAAVRPIHHLRLRRRRDHGAAGGDRRYRHRDRALGQARAGPRGRRSG